MTAEPTPFDVAAERVATGADHRAAAAALVEAMTLTEKLDCLDGDTDFWPGIADMTTGGYYRHPWPAAAVERLGVPGIQFADGPRGCVVHPATAFPVTMARGATFDPALEERVGAAIGAELRARGATYTGAVCINLLRHPGWGRAQETYGEDPHHVGEMGAALTRGLQRHVLACVKHFACNSIENARFTVDVTCDERALHEVYLPHFRRVVDEGAASVMSAYNSLNGSWCGENDVLLGGILREEWGFDGFVITDFIFGLRDPVSSVQAGCDIEMPFRQQRQQALAPAIDAGALDVADVDRRVVDIVATLLRFARVFDTVPPPDVVECDDHRALAREVATASTVLLRNDGLLPVDPASCPRVAVLGRLAAVANLGDHGSSHVEPSHTVTPLDGIRAAFADSTVTFDERDASIVEGADLAVVVVGFTAADEGEFIGGGPSGDLLALFPPPPEPGDVGPAGPSTDPPPGTPASRQTFGEGGDRRTLGLSSDDAALVTSAAARGDRVVVVLMGGSAVTMPWFDEPRAVLQVWYPGLEGGHALADVLTGVSEPGGRLPFAVPVDEAHLVDFDPDATEVTYGLLHGQWKLDRDGRSALLPFGFGLGYTTFDLDADAPERAPDGRATVTVRARNVGSRRGSTVVQVYGSVPSSAHDRPSRRLVGFVRVTAAPGEEQAATIAIDLGALDVRAGGRWLTEDEPIVLEIGQSAAGEFIRFELR